MLTGAPISLVLLALTGQLSSADVATGAALAPFAVIGLLVAPRFRPWFDERMRRTILVLCAAASVVAVHHLVLSFVLPAAVFPGGGGVGRVLVHAVILVCEAGALMWAANNIAAMFARSAVLMYPCYHSVRP